MRSSELVTPAERQMIDEAIDQGRVNKIAPGRSAWTVIEGVYISPEQPRSAITRRKAIKVARRQEVRDMVEAGNSDAEIIHAIASFSASTVKADIAHVREASSLPKAKKPKAVDPRVQRMSLRRDEVRKLVAEGLTIQGIANAVGVARLTVQTDLDEMGLTATKGKPGPPRDVAGEIKQRRAEKKRIKVKDRRRHKVATVPTGEGSKTAPAGTIGTLMRNTVLDAPADPLRDGSNQVKLGGDVLVGDLKEYRLLHLTLEERATCPETCGHWLSCYGNGMPFAKRWRHGFDLEVAIFRQVTSLMEDVNGAHRGVLVRLHTLGDFYSVEYVNTWHALLQQHPKLAVFGFSARQPGTEIGDELQRVRDKFGLRFAVRQSGHAGPMGSFTIDYPTERTMLGDALICPEQRHAMNGTGKPVHCGSCAACWQTDRCIVFVEH